MFQRVISGLGRLACETGRKPTPDRRQNAGHVESTHSNIGHGVVKRPRTALCGVRAAALCLAAAIVLLAAPRIATGQPEQAPAGAEPRTTASQPAAEKPEPAGAVEGEQHEAEQQEGVVPVLARLVNFLILIGTLVYLLRAPFATYLNDRGTQIRSDLVTAAEMKRTAAAQLEEIDRKMKALPGELETLRAQGAREIAAEEARIRSAAAAERDRLLEQARRDIDHHVKVAERDLVSHAADLAVGVAAERIRTSITDEDQKRLADRYVQQLKG
jgi:F-type H+-transporting ATPase subunit b